MIRVLNKSMKTVAVLQNAYDKEVEREVNQLWTFNFTLPITDPKVEHCKHHYYVQAIGKSGRDYGLYRIMGIDTVVHSHEVRYECEHVLSTLLDSVMDGFTTYTNLTTRQVLESLLSKQEERLWALGDCEFNRRFSYGWENENGILAPVLSVPKPFSEPYEFEYDTSSLPWVLHLRRPSDQIKSEYRWGKDIIEFNEHVDPTEIANYIIPKGAGEGVNQLEIRKINGGKNYLKDDESIAKWGKRPYIWVDRRYTQMDALKAAGEANLKDWKDPKVSITVKAADLSILPQYSHERRFLNTMSRIIVGEKVYPVRIMAEKIRDLDREFDVDYALGNKLGDIAESTAEYERKIRVNEAYSQGATSLLNYTYNDNADSDYPAVIRFYVPQEAVQINKVMLSFETSQFRSYGRATEGGGATVKSTSAGGGTTVSSSSGGGTTVSSSSGGGHNTTSGSGGGTVQSSSAGGDHRHKVASFVADMDTKTPPGNFKNYMATANSGGTAAASIFMPGVSTDLYTEGSSGNHSHSTTLPNHTHTISLNPHTHSVSIDPHNHSVTIQPHTHEITLPDHTHEIKHGIYTLSSTPSKVAIKVDGNTVNHTSTSGDDIDLVPYLSKDSNGNILRGQHHTLEIKPNALGRINAEVFTQLFLQSRGEYNV